MGKLSGQPISISAFRHWASLCLFWPVSDFYQASSQSFTRPLAIMGIYQNDTRDSFPVHFYK